MNDLSQAEGDPIIDPGELQNDLFGNMWDHHSCNRCASNLLSAFTARY